VVDAAARKLAALPLEELEVAGSALESREPPCAASAPLDPPASVGCGDRRGRSDEAPEEKGP
jgi:hypothetical protein